MYRQSAALFAAKAAGFGIRILLPVVLVRMLAKADVGAYFQFFLLEAVTMTVFQLGAAQALFYFVPRDERNAGAYLVNSLGLSVAFMAAGFALLAPFHTALAGQTGLVMLDAYFGRLAVYTTMVMVLVVLEAYTTVRGWIAATALWDVGRQVAATVATIAAAWIWRDLEHVIGALIAVRAVSIVAMAAWLHVSKRGFAAENRRVDLAAQVRYGVVLGLTGMLVTLTMRFHELFVNRFYDIETYAVYAAGIRQIPVLQYFTHSMAMVTLARFSELEKAGDWAGIRALWIRFHAGTWGLGIPVTILMVLLAKPLVLLMFTADYAGAVPIFRLNALAMLYMVMNPTLVLRAMDRNDLSLKINAAMVALLPFALYGGMKAWGLVGVIAAHGLMLMGGRLANHAALKRVAAAPLPLVPSPAAVGAFYRESWRGLRARLGAGPRS